MRISGIEHGNYKPSKVIATKFEFSYCFISEYLEGEEVCERQRRYSDASGQGKLTGDSIQNPRSDSPQA
jgi:hypothetical protein